MSTLAKSLPDNFYLDLAVGARSLEDICTIHGLELDDVRAETDSAIFKQRLTIATQVVHDDGRAFRARCRVIVEDSLRHLREMIHHPETPSAVQLEAFKTLMKAGGLEAKVETQANVPHLTFTILTPDGSRIETAINSTPALAAPDE